MLLVLTPIQAGMHYVPIIDPGISASEAPNTYPPWDEGVHLNIFVRNESNLPFIGKVSSPCQCPRDFR